jgi:hypothetical protein
MHILVSVLLIVAALTVLVLGLVGVVHDLLDRGPYETPLIKDDSLAWPPRYQRVARGSGPPAEIVGGRQFAGNAWSADRESPRG